MITVHDVEQGSPEWHQLRAGVITGSRFADVLSKGVGRQRYMYELAAEAVTGTIEQGYTNSYMEWGIATEQQARAMYELESGNTVEEIGFVTNSEFDGTGVSPDGMTGDDGMFETKSPKTTTHIEYCLANKLPAKYRAQVQGQMLICERNWVDFCSFDPRVTTGPQLLIVRVKRDDKYLDETLAPALVAFKAELDAMVEKFEAAA